MKQYLFIVFVIAYFFSCNNQPNSKSKTIDFSNTYDYIIEESKVAFKIPKKYSKTTIYEYQEIIRKSDLTDEIKSNQYHLLNKINNNFPNFDLLVDTITLENLIWIIRTGPHIEINQESAKLAVQLFTENNGKNDLIFKEEKIVEKKIIKKKWFKYIKLKLHQDYIKGERFVTHYLISTKTNTLGITFINVENDDFQNYIDYMQKAE